MRGEDFLRKQDRMARNRMADAAWMRKQEERKREERYAAQHAGPSMLDQWAARGQAATRAKQEAKAAARATQPFNLFWYERVGVVVGAAVAVLLLLSELPGPLGLLLLIGGIVFAVRAGRGRQIAASGRRTVGAFIRGERIRPQPRTAPQQPAMFPQQQPPPGPQWRPAPHSGPYPPGSGLPPHSPPPDWGGLQSGPSPAP